MENPFRPSAGATPPEILGRAGLLDEFDYGPRIGSGAPGLLTIFTGARGIGKTVMLGAAHDVAREHGWAVISETATGGFMGRIGESMHQLAEELGSGRHGRRITAVAAAGFGIRLNCRPSGRSRGDQRGSSHLPAARRQGRPPRRRGPGSGGILHHYVHRSRFQHLP
ncbi:ATP-binding protein [Tersicoccus phoenicis]|uniref:ATP-binding protein n=1 Tax=Tersicoccus phoenicis TaxID=554083 RepID=UPI001F46E204|nr:ATP-binding protein [Tersicoccus phoenicis]